MNCEARQELALEADQASREYVRVIQAVMDALSPGEMMTALSDAEPKRETFERAWLALRRHLSTHGCRADKRPRSLAEPEDQFDHQPSLT
jgi:hypothetical protein